MTSVAFGLLTLALLIPSIVLHEVAHGYVSLHFGDPTARNAGRLSLNPLRHVDLVGTVLLPLLLWSAGGPVFGYAKPVPVAVAGSPSAISACCPAMTSRSANQDRHT